jgi:asparagine synthase (glutamine-hydrolysing)
MSGIVGLFHRNGAPVDPGLLQELTRFLAYRGPDGLDTWTDANVGLGCAMLRTTRESASAHQPAQLDGRFFIVADARLDARAELLAELESAGHKIPRMTPEAELLLHAYAAWGPQCLDHLMGDFSFALWDGPGKTMFCARDHMGVKPFYFAQLGDLFIFSNTLDCVRLHPAVGEELNETAVADFLLFGLNCDNAATTFRDVRRLPPAHSLTVSTEGLRLRRHWSAPTDGRIRHHSAGDTIEHFQFLLKNAIADRLTTDRAGILLSGGLDSASIAALAREISGTTTNGNGLRAYTVVYNSLIPDHDGGLARTTAEFLDIPIRCLPMDHLRPFDRWDTPETQWPEPVDDPFFAGMFDQFQMIAADSRVVLSGEGSDNLMNFEMWPYTKDLFRQREWRTFFTEVPMYLWMRPSPWPGIRRRAKGIFGLDPTAPEFPCWIAPDLVRNLGLHARWKDWTELPEATPRHEILPTAHASLALPQWTHLFELENPGVTRCLAEVRHPFLDLRVMNFLLALPPFPWFYEKMLLREAMAGRLPEKVRLRPKTPLAGNPLVEHLQKRGMNWVDDIHWNPKMEQFIDRSALQRVAGEKISEKAEMLVRPICLNFWLQSARGVRYNLHAEVGNG